MAYNKFIPGEVRAFAGTVAPSGWFLCDGSSKSSTTYPALFSAIGTTYGGSGGNFNLPDLRGRAIAGKDNMGGSAAGRLTASESGITGTTLGSSGGVETHKLTSAQSGIVAHTHVNTLSDPTHSHTVRGASSSAQFGLDYIGSDGTGGAKAATSRSSSADYLYGVATSTGVTITNASVANQDAASKHQNTQPTIVLNYIIKF